MAGFEDLIWVTKGKNQIEVVIYAYVDHELTKVCAVTKSPSQEHRELGLTEHLVGSWWSIPNRAEMESYKREAMVYNFQAGGFVVDELTLSDCVVSHHIEALSFDGNDVPLERDSNQVLESGGLVKLKSMHSGIYDTLCLKYYEEACIVT